VSDPVREVKPSLPSTISVLKCGDQHLATKRWIKGANGRPVKIGCDTPTWYMVHPRQVANIFELHSLLKTLEGDPRACLIRGYPAQGVDITAPVRRMKHPDKDNGDKIWFEEREGQRLVLIDLDKVPVPEGIDPISDPSRAIEYLVANALPPELRDVTCVWQWSASTGMQGAGLVSAHFWFWLSRPMTGAELKAWYCSNEWLRSHENHIDTALFNDVQVHYTAAPVFEGVDNPIGERTGLRQCATHEATLQVPEIPRAPIGVGRRRMKRAGADDSYMALSLDPLSAAHGFDAKLKMLGDDGGKKRFGFHQPLTAAVAAYVYEHGTGFDRPALKAQLRDAISTAPKREGREGDLERYASDIYLDAAIESAVDKFGAAADVRIQEKADIRDAFFKRYLWVEKQEAFFDIQEHGLVSEKNVKIRHPEIGDPIDPHRNAAIQYQTDVARRRVVHNETYWPGAGLIVELGGLKLVNTWREHEFVTREGDAAPYLDLLAKVFPDKADQELLLNKMAYAIQHRGEKPNWHLILYGAPGVGKDTLLKPMLDYFGNNACSIGADDLTKSFNGYVAHEQIVVQELHTKSSRDVLNKLKPWMASPPDWINVDEKNKKPYQIRNMSSWWFTTNEPDAIKFDNSDRRFCILHSPMTTEEAKRLAEDGYFRRLHQWLANGGCGEVVHMLQTRELPADFDAQGQAPWTAAKGEMITASLGSVGQYVVDAIRNSSGVFADDIVTIKAIAESLKHHLPDADGRDLTTYRITEALKAAGAAPLDQIRLGGREGNRLRLWAVRNQDAWTNMSATELRAAYEGHMTTALELLLR